MLRLHRRRHSPPFSPGRTLLLRSRSAQAWCLTCSCLELHPKPPRRWQPSKRSKSCKREVVSFYPPPMVASSRLGACQTKGIRIFPDLQTSNQAWPSMLSRLISGVRRKVTKTITRRLQRQNSSLVRWKLMFRTLSKILSLRCETVKNCSGIWPLLNSTSVKETRKSCSFVWTTLIKKSKNSVKITNQTALTILKEDGWVCSKPWILTLLCSHLIIFKKRKNSTD